MSCEWCSCIPRCSGKQVCKFVNFKTAVIQNLYTDCGLRRIAYPISLYFEVLIYFSNVLGLFVDESGLAVWNFDEFNRENGATIWQLEKFCIHDCA